MSKAAVSRMTWFIVGLGVPAAIAAYVLAGREAGLSAAVGVAVAIANFQLLRFIVWRVVSGTVKNQALFSFVLMAKLGGLVGLIFILLHSGLVQPIAFTIGVSALVVGSLLGSFVHVLTAPAAEGEH